MRIQAVQDKSEILDIAYVKVMLKLFHLYGHTIRFQPHVEFNNIC